MKVAVISVVPIGGKMPFRDANRLVHSLDELKAFRAYEGKRLHWGAIVEAAMKRSAVSYTFDTYNYLRDGGEFI